VRITEAHSHTLRGEVATVGELDTPVDQAA
jgi:hypothetical protein